MTAAGSSNSLSNGKESNLLDFLCPNNPSSSFTSVSSNLFTATAMDEDNINENIGGTEEDNFEDNSGFIDDENKDKEVESEKEADEGEEDNSDRLPENRYLKTYFEDLQARLARGKCPAEVMEFCTSHKRKGLQVRIAWYNRLKDIINRKSADPCLLVATMHSDINPVSSIRGKCTVMHKYYVPNIDVYRKQQDHFYYTQLYDRYIQRVYDVVPCETVQNVPMDTLEALKSRYQFIVVEQGKAADLTVARRICCICQQWCQSAVSVKCAACHKSFHMSCLNPPLARKPSKGFAWQCAFCTRQEVLAESNPNSPATSASLTRSSSKASSPESLESQNQQQTTKDLSIAAATVTPPPHPTTTTTTTTTAAAASVAATKADLKRQVRATRSQVKQQQQQETLSLNSMTIEETSNSNSDTLNKKSRSTVKKEGPPDVDDRIYPRAKSRIGTKYQANVPDFAPPNSSSCTSPKGLYHEVNSVSSVRSNSIEHTSNGGSSSVRGSLHSSGDNSSSRGSPVNTSGNTASAIGSFDNASNVRSTRNSIDDMSPTRPATFVKVERDTDISTSNASKRPVRGIDDTVTVIYRPGILDEASIDSYMESVKGLDNIPLLPHSSDLMDRALYELELNNYETETAYENMSKLNGDDFKHIVEWSPAEIEAFEQSIRNHGHDLNYAKAAVKTKDMADIVRYFYQWKKTDRYEPVYSEWTKVYRPLKKFKKFPRDKKREAQEAAQLEKENAMEMGSQENTDLTIVPKATYGTKPYQCMNCLTEQSRIWRRSPSDFDRKRKVFSKVLCNDCGIFWLKYAKTKPISPETRIANIAMSSGSNNATSNPSSQLSNGDNKRKRTDFGGMRKRIKEDRESLHFDPSPCTICHVMGVLTSRLYTCYDCGMSVHNDCYGIKEKADRIGWRCDPCHNREKPVASYVYECVLCYNTASQHQPLKMTSGYCWAHVQCAAFIPEIKFVNPALLSPVEYIGCTNPARIEAKCSLCDDKRGACVACSECHKNVHVQCAVENNYRLAFDIQPLDANHPRHDVSYPIVPAGLFKPNSAPGIMVPHVLCPGHSTVGKNLIGLDARTTDELRETSLFTYVKNYKRISSNSTPAMRRYLAASSFSQPKKTAKKIPSPLDAVLDAMSVDASLSASGVSGPSRSRAILTSLSPSSSQPLSCSRCPAKYSPIWWSAGSDPSSHQRFCQRCHH
ncbi:hypothetical protein [Parasitella parasitica]|uniref:Uncharacterized protein n=1 Tax=Parasitella parasitica TaxID=35722 RepID=A0A0B7MT27_9FUNG|nr:hypothetical protein [Parasitella parasitica]